ncbi:MAG TPA: FHA domain-containing protein [Ktedonobacterales bacterium]|jgi:hypothetical protein
MAYLRIETRDGVQRIPLDRDRLRIGRLASNDVILPFRQISREHAEVERAGSVWWISDLDSTNGLQVGGRPVDRYPLQPGACVYLAPDITVSLAADDEDFDALATTQMGVAGRTADGLAGAPPLLLHLGPDGTSAPFSLPARPLDGADRGAAGMSARSQRGARLEDDDLERSAEAWHAANGAQSGARSGAAWPRGDERPPSRMDEDPEGDLFRRRSRPPSRAARAQREGGPGREQSAGTVMLHVCQTCGQLTPASGLKCQFCHHPLARPCPRCGMNLLPADDYCPRCQSANPTAARRRSSSGGR